MNSRVYGVAAHLGRSPSHDPAQRYYRHFSGAAADVYDHIARGFVDGNARAQSRQNRLFDHVSRFGPGFERGLHHRPAFGGGYAGRHGHHHLGPEKTEPAGYFFNKMPDHGFGDAVVGNDAVPDGPDGHYAFGRAADHLLGRFAHGHNFVVVQIHRHHRGFVDDNTFRRHIDQSIGRAQVNSDFNRHNTELS